MWVTRKTNHTVCESGWNCLPRRRWLQGWFEWNFVKVLQVEEEDDDDEEEAEENFDDDDDDVAIL